MSAYPPGTRVLDIGTAAGTLARICRSHDFNMSGLEPNPEWARLAEPYYDRLICSTLDHAPDEFLAGYDVVVCADVLEHLPDPQAALHRIVSLQRPGAAFLVSVPNVANITVRLALLAGKFNYTDRGILDRTHLKFFTRRSFLEFVHDQQLQVEALHTTPIPLNLVHPFFETSWFGRSLHGMLARITCVFPGLFGYQFIVKAVKAP